MEWILFGIGVAVIGLIGIGLGLVAGRAWARRAERRSGGGDDAFMTPVGSAPEAPEAPKAPEAPTAAADATGAATGAAADDAAGGNGPSDRDA